MSEHLPEKKSSPEAGELAVVGEPVEMMLELMERGPEDTSRASVDLAAAEIGLWRGVSATAFLVPMAAAAGLGVLGVRWSQPLLFLAAYVVLGAGARGGARACTELVLRQWVGDPQDPPTYAHFLRVFVARFALSLVRFGMVAAGLVLGFKAAMAAAGSGWLALVGAGLGAALGLGASRRGALGRWAFQRPWAPGAEVPWDRVRAVEAKVLKPTRVAKLLALDVPGEMIRRFLPAFLLVFGVGMLQATFRWIPEWTVVAAMALAPVVALGGFAHLGPEVGLLHLQGHLFHGLGEEGKGTAETSAKLLPEGEPPA